MPHYAHFDCENCGTLHDSGLVDGYLFGERLLEGVMFVTKFNLDTQKWEVDVRDDAKPYFARLNANLWLSEAIKFCERNDIWTCPACGGDTFPVKE